MTNPFDLGGQVALVTGAGRGLGKAAALALAEAGANLALVSRTATEVGAVASQIEASGRRATAIPVDLASAGGVGKVVGAATAVFDRIDILVNCAANIQREDSIEDCGEAIEELWTLNLKAPTELCVAVGGLMMKQGRGKIINISSLAGRLGYGELGGYGATKAALSSITRSLAVKFASGGHNIQVNSIAPGAFATTFGRPGAGEQRPNAATEPRVARTMARIPLGRPGEPEEIGGAVVFLASAASDYMTGQELVIDGGLSIYAQ